MITDALLGVLYTIVSGAWSLVPAWTIEVPDMQPVVSELSKWNGILPITEIAAITGILGALFVALIGFKVVVKIVDWIADVIP